MTTLCCYISTLPYYKYDYHHHRHHYYHHSVCYILLGYCIMWNYYIMCCYKAPSWTAASPFMYLILNHYRSTHMHLGTSSLCVVPSRPAQWLACVFMQLSSALAEEWWCIIQKCLLTYPWSWCLSIKGCHVNPLIQYVSLMALSVVQDTQSPPRLSNSQSHVQEAPPPHQWWWARMIGWWWLWWAGLSMYILTHIYGELGVMYITAELGRGAAGILEKTIWQYDYERTCRCITALLWMMTLCGEEGGISCHVQGL